MKSKQRSISLRGSGFVIALVAVFLLMIGVASTAHPHVVSAQTAAAGSGMGGCDLNTSWCVYCTNHSDSDRCAAYPPGPNAVIPNPALGQVFYGPLGQVLYGSALSQSIYGPAQFTGSYGTSASAVGSGMGGCDMNTSWCVYCTNHPDSDRCAAYPPGPQ